MQPYQQILAGCGYPTDILTVDFESYFDDEYSLKKMSTIEYINNPRFELTGLGLYFSDTDKYVFHTPNDIKDLLNMSWDDAQELYENYTVVVQNARFDATILQTKFNIVPKYIIDIKDLACHYDAQMSHKLKDLAILFGLQPKGKTENFKGLHYKDMTPEQRKALAEYCLNDVDLETKLFKILLPFLSNPEVELKLMRHTLDLWLHRGFDFDKGLADSLKTQMSCNISLAASKVSMTPEELRSQKFIKRLREVLPANEKIPTKLSNVSKVTGLRKEIPALAKNDDGCQFLLNHPKQEVRELIEARQAVKSWPLHHKRVDNMLRQANANGGTLRVPLNYHGTHTGRATGGEDINLLNLGGKKEGVDPLISQMRSLLKAPIGFKLGLCDSSQIEARILVWLAGQKELLEGFAAGKDVYSKFAGNIFSSPVRDERETDPEPVKKLMGARRGFGKQGILGLGFGMGAGKFYVKCLETPSLRPSFIDGTYDAKFCERVVKTYRITYPEIPAYWKKVENAFRQALKYPHLKPKVGQLEFSAVGHEVRIKLPSSRVLYYRHCSVGKSEYGFPGKLKYHHGHLWGGSITENIVQAISACLLRFWLFKCEEAGLPAMLHTYDEIVSLIKSSDDLKTMKEIFCSLPQWAEGLPVGAKVKESNVYCK